MTHPEHTHSTEPNTETKRATPNSHVMPAPEFDHLVLPVGTHVAEFVITGLIGIGGFGIVYEARDESLDRVVALKEYMPSALAVRQQGNTVSAKSQRNADTFLAGLRSFVNEARMLALFNHPALVKVYRFWESNGTAYMVMPLYQGQTLKKALADMQTPPSEAWLRQLLHPLLEALEIIHAKNCFHRDIAPDNIFLLADGQPVLLDFGAARQVISNMANNLTVILKPGYAPIEQYASDPNMPQGAWTDIYALGAVMYLAISGHEPHASISRIVNDNYQPLAQRGIPRYSQTLLQTIDKTLALKPADRPQNVDEFRSLLTQAVGAPVATPLPAQVKAQPPVMPAANAPHRPAGPWVLATLVLLLGASGYFLTRSGPPPAAVSPVLAATAATLPGPTQAAPTTPAITIQPTVSAPAATAPTDNTPTTPDASILTEMRETATPTAAAKSASSAVASAPVTAVASSQRKKEAKPAPPWLREMRQKLASCDARGLLEALVCIEQTRKKYCDPSHWGEVEECRLNNGLADD